MLFKRIILIIFSLIPLACGSSLEKHKNYTPKLELFEYFEGNTKAWGMVLDRKGNQINRFEVDIVGKIISESRLELVEDFVYMNGDKQQRIWMIDKVSSDSYVGRAGDIVGQAEGYVMGNALNWKYILRLKTKKGEFSLAVDDWMFLQDQDHLFNVTELKKFGFTLATVHIFFQKKIETN